MNYILLAVAVIFEVIGTSLLKTTEGFTKVLPSIALLGCYSMAFYLMSIVVKTIPVGIVYATWSAGGIVLVSAISYFIFKQSLDLTAILGLGLIIAGVIIINVFSKAGTH
ncbi:SMR family transporter [Peredibacter starrii]|uniref:SMR family transporter n=1 Tax=Peredibacter starrii TaxID=28202 RepID=A0AAX4HM40_9BACT|nr:SMR family transporter [Peredibacter starrii]WPU64333.1 SMR family transporter [Peredibacter starrii]